MNTSSGSLFKRITLSMDELDGVVAEVSRLLGVFKRFNVSTRPLPGAAITPRMLTLLQYLAGNGPLTLTDLVERLNLSKATTTELADRLEARQLITRVRDDQDTRKVYVWLTEAGYRQAGALPAVVQHEKLARALALMSPPDRDHLVKGLRALAAAEKEVQNNGKLK